MPRRAAVQERRVGPRPCPDLARAVYAVPLRVRAVSWRQRRCDRRGHDWFPGLSAREFIATSSICLRCDARQVVLPYGECLSGHPISEHYREDGTVVATAKCGGPA